MDETAEEAAVEVVGEVVVDEAAEEVWGPHLPGIAACVVLQGQEGWA